LWPKGEPTESKFSDSLLITFEGYRGPTGRAQADLWAGKYDENLNRSHYEVDTVSQAENEMTF